MPDDPNWPQHGERLTSFQLREQWNSVAALAAQPGSAGPAGPQGEVSNQQLSDAINPESACSR
ncbi:MAG: hypothetical protein NTY01_07360 [Verrucomicrobia bacterium]|nr:hypothetical protein [Verrucomicrobiota bacterium]